MSAYRGLSAAIVALAALAAAQAHAATLQHFTSAWFLGDSLSDPENLFRQTGGQVPEPDQGYPLGKRSNGPLWSEHVAGTFQAKGLPTRNFAYVFATAARNDDLDPALGRPAAITEQIPDLPDQVATFKDASVGQLGARPLVSIWAGANDVFDAIRVVDTTDPAGAAQEVALASQRAALSVAGSIGDLSGFGVKDFLVLNLPALEKTPAFSNPLFGQTAAAPLAELGTNTFNAVLAASLAGLTGAERPNIIGLDIYSDFNALIEDPGAFGLEDATTPCLLGTDCSKSVFYDGVHPTAATHAIIGDLALTKVAPVPLPAPALLLMAGLAGIAVTRARSIRRPPPAAARKL
jgi:outer membrane lipase/esterase